MYKKIRIFKKKGFDRKDIGIRLNKDPRTISKYWNMSLSEFIQYKETAYGKDSLFTPYFDEIQGYQDLCKKQLSAAAIYDVLEENHGKLPGSERTLRHFMKAQRKKGFFQVDKSKRVYHPVELLPAGKQLQLDFGQFRNSENKKIYFQAAVLAHSRYKFVSFLDRPFKTLDVILFLLDCFTEMSGRPEELVIDQDAVLVVSENKGNIIYTKLFEDFIKEQELKMFVCRKADPESKGKVENLVKFVKNNFLAPRSFTTIEALNKSCRKWLKRRANGRPSAATKLIPSEAFLTEKESFRKLKRSIYSVDALIDGETRKVSRDGCISVNAFKYSTPPEYSRGCVKIKVIGDDLFIYDLETNEEIARYRVGDSSAKNKYGKRTRKKKAESLKELKEKLKEKFKILDWKSFVESNYKQYIRYYRDQYKVAEKRFTADIEISELQDALTFCIENSTFSFVDLHDTYISLKELRNLTIPLQRPMLTGFIFSDRPEGFEVTKRDITFYTDKINEVPS
jgi:transposase